MPPTVLAIVAHSRSRRFRIAGYGLLAVSGVALAIAHDLFVFHEWTWITMSTFLTVGGLLCSFGQWKRIWPPEYMGLPLIWSAMFVFTFLNVTTIADAEGVYALLAVANTSLLLGFSVLVFSRWLDVAAVYRAAKEVRERDAER